MAQGQPISYSDIANKSDIEALKKDLSDIAKVIGTLKTELSSIKKGLSSNPLGSGKDLKKYNDELAKANDLTGDVLRLKTQQIQTEKKIAASQTVEGKKLAEAKIQLQEFNAKQKQQIKLGLAAESSMNKLTLELAKNKKAYRDLTAEQRKNSKIGGKLLKDIKKQDKEIKKLDASLGEHQRNVGNYTGALGSMAQQYGILPTQITGAVQSMKMFNISLKTMKGAIIGIGIGALVIGLVSLIQYFTRTEEGASKFNKVLNYIKVPVEVLMQYFGELGEKIFNAFSNPKKAASDFLDFIKGQFVNRFKALGKMFVDVGEIAKNIFNPSEARKHITELMKHSADFATGVEDVTKKVEDGLNEAFEETKKKIKESNELEDKTLLITKKKRTLQVGEAKLLAEIADARRQANDETLTAKNQSDAILKAEQLTAILGNKKLYIARLELDLLKKKAAMFDSDGTTLDEIAAKEKEIFNIEKSRDDQIRSISRRKTTINNKLKKQIELQKQLSAIDVTKDDGFDSISDKYDAEAEAVVGKNDKISESEKQLTETINDQTAASLELQKKELAAKNQMLGATGDLFTGVSQMMEKGSAEQKAFASAGAVIDTFSTISGIIKSYSGTGPWGIALGAVLAASAGVAGFLRVQQINNTPTPKAKKYKSGSEYIELNGNPRGIDTIPAYLNEGERVVPTDINRMLMGIPNTELPSLVKQGKEKSSPELAIIAKATHQTQLYLSNLKWVDEDGNEHDLNGKITYRA